MSARSHERTWQPTLGAWCEPGGTRFRVWAPTTRRVSVVVETADAPAEHELEPASDGTFSAVVAGGGAGDRYRYRLDRKGPYPDPASRFQPDGVHGPSQVIDPRPFTWSDRAWPGLRLEDLALYELHVGTFSAAGTFTAVIERLPYLRDLGVTAIELMPVAEFPGQRNWGYDGVALFAPARCYGHPDDLRRLVDAAHGAGLGVILDVVYNHLGPDGAYLGTFSPYYFSSQHSTPWGAAVNLDETGSEMVRRFFIENALHWVHEYHIDGLRLDATHAMIDDTRPHFLAELTAAVHGASRTAEPPLVIAEDHRNLACMLRPRSENGWGLDAVWADDFHHQMRRALAGDHEGYFADFVGAAADIAETVRRGWFYRGQQSVHFGVPRGTDTAGLLPRRFVIGLQNHDQIGNRALGERLHHQIDLAAYRAATVLLLCAPETPLLFMGQDWAASTPFLYFTDHHAELGRQVTVGRREEFKAFAAFADPAARQRIPDPQDPDTFVRSQLRWEERDTQPHASVSRLYAALLHLRRTEPALRSAKWDGCEIAAPGPHALLMRRADLLIAIQLCGAGAIELRGLSGSEMEIVLSTEAVAFAPDPVAAVVDGSRRLVRFARPGAIILREGISAGT